MKDRGAMPSHINKTIGIAKHLDRYLKINELQDFTLFKEQGLKQRDILSPSEIEKVATCLVPYSREMIGVNQRQKALIMLMGTTGCRIGEALNLQQCDVLSFPFHVVFRNTKNGDDRYVPISESLYNQLQALGKKEVFVSYRGGRLTEAQVNLDLKKRADMCGIKKPIHNHLFRHSYITTMLSNGVQWMDLAPIVGHKDPKTTMRYSHFAIDHYADIVHMHPLLRKNQSPQDVIARIKKAILACGLDDERFKYEITESGKKLLFHIEHLEEMN